VVIMILAILQARVSSTRLPGKVLKPILGMPMIFRQIERLKHAKKIDKLIVATSTDSSDDQLAIACQEFGIECYRGNLNDVLDRFYGAAEQDKPEHVVRLTGDCPLADPEIIDRVIEHHLQGKYDYTSNTIEPTYPDGLDAEIMTYSCLQHMRDKAKKQSEREHVTLFIYNNKKKFNIGSVKNNIDLSQLRWTVDEPEDFMLVEAIYQDLYCKNSLFLTNEILCLIADNQKLKDINVSFNRNEGLMKSLKNDGSDIEI